MNDFIVLAGLDYRRMRNFVRTMVRSPGRLLLWTGYAVWLAFMIFSRTLNAHLDRGVHLGVRDPYSTLIALGFICFAGGIAYRAAGGQVGAFASRADARFLTSSHLNERAVVTWLQIRSSATIIARFLFLIVLYTMVFHTAGTIAGMMLSMIAIAAFLGAIPIPALALARRIGARAAQTAALLLLIAGGIPAIVIALDQWGGLSVFAAASRAIVNLHAGSVVNEMFGGSALPVCVLLLAAVAMLWIAYTCATDLYPELYAASQTGFDRAARIKGFARGTPAARYTVAPQTRTRIPFSGAWTALWKDWTGVRRSRRFGLSVSLGIALPVAAGLAGAAASRHNDDPSLFPFIAFPTLLAVVILFSITAAVSLAGDFRKPLWWLTRDHLRVRFYAWIMATSWRLCAVLLIAVGTYCAAAGNWAFIGFGAGGTLIAVILVRTVGLATYAMVPAAADQRGPLAMVRIFIVYGLLVPPAVAGMAVAVASHRGYFEMLPAALTAVPEAALLVEFARWRIDGNGSAFALAEAGG